MAKGKPRFWLVTGLVAYVLLLGAAFWYLESPWNWAATMLFGFKALAFWAVIRQASTLGTGRRLPPR